MRSIVIGVVLNLYQEYGRGILRGVRRYMSLHPDSQIHLVSYTGEISPGAFEDRRIDGVIGVFTHRSGGEECLRLIERHFPGRAVSVSSRQILAGMPHVVSDNRAIGALAARFLLERGYRCFVYVPEWQDPRHHASGERLEGFASTLAEAGMEPHVKDLHQISRLSKTFPRPFGLYAFNDLVARNAVENLLNRGLQIPADVAVMGTDNDEMESLVSRISLTSVRSDLETIGYIAAERLVQRLQGGNSDASDLTLVPPLDVVERRSTDVLASPDPVLQRFFVLLRNEVHLLRSVSEISKRVGVSRRTLENRVKESSGLTVLSAVKEARLRRASSLLRETDLTISQIADRSGYTDSRAMSRDFGAWIGQTPRSYRKLHRQFILRTDHDDFRR